MKQNIFIGDKNSKKISDKYKKRQKTYIVHNFSTKYAYINISKNLFFPALKGFAGLAPFLGVSSLPAV